MARVLSVLLSTLCFFVSCLCQAHGYEVSQELQKLSSCPQQSPIAFDVLSLRYRPYRDFGLMTNYYPAKAQAVIIDQDTPQVNFLGQAGSLLLEGRYFNLKEFHFHRPNEHKFTHYPQVCNMLSLMQSGSINYENHFVLEMHLVHETPGDDSIAVIGMMFRLGEHNRFLDRIWPSIREAQRNGNSSDVPQLLDVNDLVFSDVFIQYNGSLTTPPYTLGVRWTVPCGNWQTISRNQLIEYETLFPRPNNRPIQIPLACNGAVLNFPVLGSSEAKIEQEGATLVQSP